MAPSVELQETTVPVINGKNATNGGTTKTTNGGTTKSQYPTPLRTTGALDSAFKFDEVTPAVGREYPTANIVDDLLNASNSDDLLRDLAITSESPLELIPHAHQSIRVFFLQIYHTYDPDTV